MSSEEQGWRTPPYWREFINDWMLYKVELGLLKREHPQRRLERKAKLLDGSLRSKGSDHAITSFRKKRMADTLEELGRLDDARQFRREHLDACRRNVGGGHHWTLSAELALAQNLERSGYAAEARELTQHVVAARPNVRGTDKTEMDRAVTLLERLK